MAFNQASLERLWAHIIARLGDKVDKEDGKTLSSCDYTQYEKNRLATLQTKEEIATLPNPYILKINGYTYGGEEFVEVPVDSEITADSSNLVTSSAVAKYVPERLYLQDAATGQRYALLINNGELVISNISLEDFTYTTEEDGTSTLTGWNETYLGMASTECIIPDSAIINL